MTNFKPKPFSLSGYFHRLTGTALLLCLFLHSTFGQTYTIAGVNYTPCGTTETVVAPFNNPAGAATTGLYSGMVRLTVSGTGASLGSIPGDAFYIGIPGSPSHDVNHYQLVTTKQGDVVVKNNDDAYRHIVYDIDAGIATSTPYLPPYRPNNTYSFIIDMSTISPFNLNPVKLRVGVNDGNYGDNFCSGCTNNYVVQVTQLCAPPPCDDADSDGICDEDDNCPFTANADQADADNDGVGNACDGCPGDGNKTAPGQCGCGTADTDSDSDGTADCNDACPNDPAKTAPGICGCGTTDTDSDSDGTADCNDACPNDPAKTAPGICGCGTADTDSDSDGTADCNDLCPNDPNKVAPGQCGCGNPDTDNDGDGIANCNDNCDNTANPNQADSDCDGVGNTCDVCPGGNDAVDNNNDGLPDCKYPPAFNQIIAAWKCGNNKVYVCHIPPGNPNNANTLCIAYSALAAHIAHGDYLGTCGNASCTQFLIAPGNNSTDEMTDHQQLELFPNPAGSEVNIHLHGFGGEPVRLAVFDLAGRVVWQKMLVEEGHFELTLDLSEGHFGNGVYMVRASTGKTVLTQRLVVSKQ